MSITDITDIPFDEALDVRDITYRLHSIDVGFDLRAEGTTVQFGEEPRLRVSYETETCERRVMEGPRKEVLARLRKLGYTVE